MVRQPNPKYAGRVGVLCTVLFCGCYIRRIICYYTIYYHYLYYMLSYIKIRKEVYTRVV
jgi:hypothetical protein